MTSRPTASVGALVALALVLQPPPASGLRFTSNFSSIKVEAQPGETVGRSFHLQLTPGEGPAQFRARMEDFWQSEDGEQSFYRPAGTVERSCAPWVSLNPVEESVEVGGSLDVRLSIAVPGDVGAGGYWCALTIDEVPNPLAAPVGVGVQFLASVSIGVFVYVPPVVREARILEVRLDGELARVRVANDGNAPFAVEGRFEFLHPGATEPIASASLPRTTVLLEPMPTRWIEVPLPGIAELPSGRYLVRAVIDVGLDHYLGVQREMDVRRAASRPDRP